MAKRLTKAHLRTGLMHTTAENLSSNQFEKNALATSNTRFRDIAILTLAGVVQADVSGKITFANKRWCQMLGYTEAELLTMNISEVIQENRVASSIPIVNDYGNGGPNYLIEKRFLRKDGSNFWGSGSVNTMRSNKGEHLGLFAVVIDITERKNAELALQKSEANIQSILESIKDGFFALNDEWRFTYINKAAEIQLNINAYDNIGKSIFELYPALIGSNFEKNYTWVKENKKSVTFTEYYPDHEAWYEISAYPAVNGITVYFRNVTDQIISKEILRLRLERSRIIADISSQLVLVSSSNEQNLRSLLESVFTNVAQHLKVEYFISFDADIETQTMLLAASYGLNSAQKAVFAKVEFKNNFCGDVARTQKPLILESMQNTFPGKSVLPDEFQVDTYAGFPLIADGCLHGTVCFATLFRPNFNAEELELIKTVADLTAVALQRNLTNRSLVANELKYRTLYESIDEGYCTLEIILDDANAPINCRYVEVNPAFEQQTGLINASGKTFTEVMPGIEINWIEIYGNVGIKGESIRFESYVTPLKRWFNCYAFCLSKVLPSKVGVLFADITERKRRDLNLQFLAEIQLQLSFNADFYTSLEIVGEKIRQHFDFSIFALADVDISSGIANTFFSLHDDDIETATGTHLLADFLTNEHLQSLTAGETIVINNINHATFEKNEESYQKFKICAVIHTPFLIKENCKFVLTGTKRTPYDWQNNEIELLRELTARIYPQIARARVELRIHKNERRYRALLEASSQIIYRMNADVTLFTIIKGNDSIGTAYKEPNWLARYVVPEDQSLVMHTWHEAILNKIPFEIEHRVPLIGGNVGWVFSRATPLLDDAGNILEWFGAASDITERKLFEDTMWQHAYYDTLTGLPNRRLFHDRLEQAIKKAHRSGLKVALFFIDLDRFKEVNDLHGHIVGDVLLKEVSQRISACVREFDTVARLGGDEFTAILSELDNTTQSEIVAQKILDYLAKPFILGREVIHLTTSIGITFYPDDASDADSLIGNADKAMYAAKYAGRSQYIYFMQSMQHQAVDRLRLIEDLRQAVIKGEFEVNYQPIINFTNGEIIKAEALLRWNHPTQGRIDPSVFIPLAEDAGLINAIGDWVFTEVAACTKYLAAYTGKPFQISVNKSPVQFRAHSKNLDWVNHLYKNDIPADNICMEITEGLLLDISVETRDKIMQYRRAGISIAIDDFGIGYSSMAYLKKFEIDYLKIDQSFIQDMTAGKINYAIVKSMIAMAHALDVKVIAEGIETQEQYQLLLEAGCDFGQGFLFSPALPLNELLDFLQASDTSKLKERKLALFNEYSRK